MWADRKSTEFTLRLNVEEASTFAQYYQTHHPNLLITEKEISPTWMRYTMDTLQLYGQPSTSSQV